jgi:hypothetical protein
MAAEQLGQSIRFARHMQTACCNAALQEEKERHEHAIAASVAKPGKK